MKVQFSAIAAAVVLASAGSVSAAEIKSVAELGIVVTDGNTETQTLNAKVSAKTEYDNWRQHAYAEGLKTSSGDTTLAKKGLVGFQTNYKFGKHSYAYGLVEYENEAFSGYNYRTKEALGYGYRAIGNDSLTLDLETGPGARQSKLTSTGETEDEFFWRVAGDLEWKISKTATFTEKLTADIGEDTTIIKSVTGIQAQIANNLAMKASLTIKNTSDVPPGIKETDSETGLTLVYSF